MKLFLLIIIIKKVFMLYFVTFLKNKVKMYSSKRESRFEVNQI